MQYTAIQCQHQYQYYTTKLQCYVYNETNKISKYYYYHHTTLLLCTQILHLISTPLLLLLISMVLVVGLIGRVRMLPGLSQLFQALLEDSFFFVIQILIYNMSHHLASYHITAIVNSTYLNSRSVRHDSHRVAAIVDAVHWSCTSIGLGQGRGSRRGFSGGV